MFESIHHVTQLGLEAYAGKPRHEWVLEWPGMVVLVVTAIYWTRGACTLCVCVSCVCVCALCEQLQYTGHEVRGLSDHTEACAVLIHVWQEV